MRFAILSSSFSTPLPFSRSTRAFSCKSRGEALPAELCLGEPTATAIAERLAALAAMPPARLDELRREGLGVLMVSSDLPELLGMSDRVLVLGDGTLKASLRAEQATPEALLHAALEPSSQTDAAKWEAR